MNQSRYITRKEIAAANEISEDTVARLEKRIGLDKCKDHACGKPVRYHAAEARRILKENGMVQPS